MRTFFVILVLGMFAGTSSALAWTGPSAAPPSSNTLAPVNIGTSDQVKNGGLSLNSLAIFGNTLLSGTTNYLNFGTVAGVTGYGIRNNSGIVEAKSSGASWGKVFTTDTEMTQTRDDAGLQGSAGARSGFFQTSAPVNYPAGATSWWHLIEARHTNTANNYALQIAGSFFDQNLYFRKLNNSPSTPWSKVVAQDSTGVVSITGNVGVGTTTPAQKLSVAGTIYSSSGGFQFPDGTVQTSAAVGGVPAGTVGGGCSGDGTGWGNASSCGGNYCSATMGSCAAGYTMRKIAPPDQSCAGGYQGGGAGDCGCGTYYVFPNTYYYPSFYRSPSLCVKN